MMFNKFKSLFAKQRDFEEIDTEEIDTEVAKDLPESEDLEEKFSHEKGSFFQPSLPGVTKLNKTVIAAILGALGLVVFGAVFSAANSNDKNKKTEIAQESAAATTSSAPSITKGMPTTPNTNDKGKLNQTNKESERSTTQQYRQPLNPPVSYIPPANISYRQSSTPSFPTGLTSFTGLSNILSDKEKELADALKSPISFFNEAKGQIKSAVNSLTGNTPALAAPAPASSTSAVDARQSQNDQDEKRDFINNNNSSTFYASSGVVAPRSEYELKAGSIIPGVLMTGINSDLPGNIVGQVSENVYDSVRGEYLLIPQGTRVIGVYDSKVSYSQERILIVWNRLIFPNGDSISLEGAQGTDVYGYSGFSGNVNNHTSKLINAALITSFMSAGAQMASGNSTAGSQTYGQMASQGVAENISSIGSKIAEKNLNIQPTIEIPQGYRFNIFVDKDFVLKPYNN